MEEAKKIKEKRRNVLPGVYNAARLNEKPLPLLVLVSNAEQQISDNDVTEQSAAYDPLVTSLNSIDLEAETEYDQHAVENNPGEETDMATNSLENGLGASALQDPLDTSLNSIDLQPETEHVHQNKQQPIKPEPVFTQLDNENAQAVEDILNESYENCDDSGDVLVCSRDEMPMPNFERIRYEVKQSDIISGNLAFATNVRVFNHIE